MYKHPNTLFLIYMRAYYVLVIRNGNNERKFNYPSMLSILIQGQQIIK